MKWFVFISVFGSQTVFGDAGHFDTKAACEVYLGMLERRGTTQAVVQLTGRKPWCDKILEID